MREGKREVRGGVLGGWGQSAVIVRACLHLSSASHKGQGLTSRDAAGQPAARLTLWWAAGGQLAGLCRAQVLKTLYQGHHPFFLLLDGRLQ